MGTVVLILDIADSFIYKGCPFFAAGIVVGAVYWCAVTYGAITVMQVRKKLNNDFNNEQH